MIDKCLRLVKLDRLSPSFLRDMESTDFSLLMIMDKISFHRNMKERVDMKTKKVNNTRKNIISRMNFD